MADIAGLMCMCVVGMVDKYGAWLVNFDGCIAGFIPGRSGWQLVSQRTSL